MQKLLDELVVRLQDDTVVKGIADALISEASGGWQGRGGPSTIRAVELLCRLLDGTGQSPSDMLAQMDDRTLWQLAQKIANPTGQI